jgi:hypothetical protein
MKTRELLVTVATVSLLASGCSAGDAAGSSDQSTGTHSSGAQASSGTTGHHMTPEEMTAMAGPSRAAAMMCSNEIRSVVQRTFHLAHPPTPARRWSATNLTLACSYRLPSGTLRMTVQDAPNERTGRPYYQRLRGDLTGATPIRGVQSLGFPALETRSGSVIFLKDGKTLRVDASDIVAHGLPAGFTRAEAAYAVAAAVIACWSE